MLETEAHPPSAFCASVNQRVALPEAWEELDEYLKTGKNREKPQSKYQYEQSWSPPPGFDETLKHAYANLDVPFGVPFEEVKRSYKNLVRKYHPDRFALDPEKQKLATQITQRINESFQKIKKFTKKQH